MAIRSNHYDVAFEHLLRQIRRPYVAVNEAKRALAGEASLKSLDFIVYAPQATNLLVDVKGRRFPTGGPHGHCWESWTDAEEIDSLVKWEQVFGLGFRSVLVFAYEIIDQRHLEKHSLWWEFRRRKYAFYGVYASDYAARMKRRSPRWETVSLPASAFREIRRPLLDLL